MVNSPVPSEHPSEQAEDYTDEQIAELKADADAEATAFKNDMRSYITRLNELYLHQLDADIQPGTPDSDEFMRLSEVREDILDNRRTTQRLRDIIDNTASGFRAYRTTLPTSKPSIRGPITRRYNQYMAQFKVDEQLHTANAHIAKMTQLARACDDNLVLLRAQIDLARAAATAPPAADADAAPAADADAAGDGVIGATAAVTTEKPAETGRHRKTYESTRAATDASPTKDLDPLDRTAYDTAKDFGDSTTSPGSSALSRGRSGGTPPPPGHESRRMFSTVAGGTPSATVLDKGHSKSPRRDGRTPPPSRDRGTGSVFGPSRSDIAASSSSSSEAASRPLAFKADGTRLLPAEDTGPDFSLYGSNPFYIHSAVKLPIPADSIYNSSTKEQVVAQTQLKPLEPPTFAGHFLHWPRFRDKFIRLVHTPGRYLTDDDRFEYLLPALKGDALARASSYISGHGDGNYHHVTAALEAEYCRPFQASKVLRHEFLQLKPKNNTAEALRHFVEDTVRAVNLLRDYDDDIIRDRFALDAWMERIPHQTRLEMCRTLEPSPDLSLEEAVKALIRVAQWQTNAAIFSPTCGLGSTVKHSGALHAITSGQTSNGPIINEEEEERTGGFFGTPKGRPDISMASCCFCGRKADHWPSTCPVYDTAYKRTQRALQLQFCLLCLKRGHRIGDPSCRAMPNPCRFCNATIHHKALCGKYIPYNKRRTTAKLRTIRTSATRPGYECSYDFTGGIDRRVDEAEHRDDRRSRLVVRASYRSASRKRRFFALDDGGAPAARL